MDLMKSSARIPVVFCSASAGCWLSRGLMAGTLGQDDGGMRLPDGTRVGEGEVRPRSEVKLSGTLLVPRVPRGKTRACSAIYSRIGPGEREEKFSIARAPQAAFRDFGGDSCRAPVLPLYAV
jgi:hypothetical protein